MITLWQGDCLEYMKSMPDKSVDAVITDPPYGIGADKGTDGFGVRSGRHYAPLWDNKTPDIEVFTKILSIGKGVFIFGGNYFTDKLPVSGHWLVWDKVGEIKFKNPFSDCELIYTNQDKKTVNKYIVIQQGFIAQELERFHPTQKPVQLITRIILDNTSEGDTIFDPFMGSGTTGVACVQTGRNFIGVEIDPGYFKIAERRIAEAQLQMRLPFPAEVSA
jgi:site-specific DNA-methyltransferase (adenine-specific)